MTLYNEWCKIKRFVPPSKQETIDLLVVSLIIGFIVSFNYWGSTSFDATEGVRNLLGASALALLTLVIHHGAQRLMAVRVDVKAEQRMWIGGSLAALLVAFVTRGALPFIALTRTEITDLPYQRLGHYRYKLGTVGRMSILLAGPLANAIVALVVWSLTKTALHSLAMDWFISMNLLMAVYCLLPIPPLEGAFIFFVSRWFYAAVFVGGLVAALCYLSNVSGWSLVLFVILGMVVGGFGWHFTLDRD